MGFFKLLALIAFPCEFRDWISFRCCFVNKLLVCIQILFIVKHRPASTFVLSFEMLFQCMTEIKILLKRFDFINEKPALPSQINMLSKSLVTILALQSAAIVNSQMLFHLVFRDHFSADQASFLRFMRCSQMQLQ